MWRTQWMAPLYHRSIWLSASTHLWNHKKRIENTTIFILGNIIAHADEAHVKGVPRTLQIGDPGKRGKLFRVHLHIIIWCRSIERYRYRTGTIALYGSHLTVCGFKIAKKLEQANHGILEALSFLCAWGKPEYSESCPTVRVSVFDSWPCLPQHIKQFNEFLAGHSIAHCLVSLATNNQSFTIYIELSESEYVENR